MLITDMSTPLADLGSATLGGAVPSGWLDAAPTSDPIGGVLWVPQGTYTGIDITGDNPYNGANASVQASTPTYALAKSNAQNILLTGDNELTSDIVVKAVYGDTLAALVSQLPAGCEWNSTRNPQATTYVGGLGEQTFYVDYDGMTQVQATVQVGVPGPYKATYGDTLGDATLDYDAGALDTPTGWSWDDAATTSVGEAGLNYFAMSYVGAAGALGPVQVAVRVSKGDPQSAQSGVTGTYGQTLAQIGDQLPIHTDWVDGSQPVYDDTSGTATYPVAGSSNKKDGSYIESNDYHTQVLVNVPVSVVLPHATATYGDKLSTVTIINNNSAPDTSTATGWAWDTNTQTVGTGPTDSTHKASYSGGHGSNLSQKALQITVKSATITGKVTDANGNVEDALLELLDGDGNPVEDVAATTAAGEGTIHYFTATTASDGTYALPGMDNANYQIRVSKDGYATQTDTDGLALTNENFTLQHTSVTLSGGTGHINLNLSALDLANGAAIASYEDYKVATTDPRGYVGVVNTVSGSALKGTGQVDIPGTSAYGALGPGTWGYALADNPAAGTPVAPTSWQAPAPTPDTTHEVSHEGICTGSDARTIRLWAGLRANAGMYAGSYENEVVVSVTIGA
jgi:hypothetical protein